MSPYRRVSDDNIFNQMGFPYGFFTNALQLINDRDNLSVMKILSSHLHHSHISQMKTDTEKAD